MQWKNKWIEKRSHFRILQILEKVPAAVGFALSLAIKLYNWVAKACSRKDTEGEGERKGEGWRGEILR